MHHAILFLVPPSLVKAAETANNGGKGWTCFGEPPVLGTGLKQFLSMPWLSAWAPGKGKDVLPATTGTPLPKGSLIIMQVHYNLLAGDLPVRPHVQLDTVPASANLRPTSIQPLVAIPNIPCPAGVTGPLCDRTAELANLSKRFGPYINLFDAGVERICGENPANPPTGVTTSCTWQVRQAGYIVRAAPHMHLLGKSLKITLNPGTASAKTVLNVPNYDFNNQAAHDNTPWIKVAPGDQLQVTCTYNPKLAQELPPLRQLPAALRHLGRRHLGRDVSRARRRGAARPPRHRRLGGPDGRDPAWTAVDACSQRACRRPWLAVAAVACSGLRRLW